MFVVIHGENQAKTRTELQRIVAAAKNRNIQDIVSLDGKSVELAAIIQNLESGSLFGGSTRLTIIENLHKRRAKTELKTITDYLISVKPTEVNLVLWEGDSLTPAQAKKFTNAEMVAIKPSLVIFKLTDAITPTATAKLLLPLLRTACAEDSPEMVLIMVARQLRMLIQTFDPGANLPPWQRSKLTLTANKFGLDRLIELHHQLAVIDMNNKSGRLPVNLQSELEFWLMTSLGE